MNRTAGTKENNEVLMSFDYDVIIIGGGPGGTRAAKILGANNKRVALVSDNLGGECLNFGCIPSKTYLWTAEFFEKIAGAGQTGIDLNCEAKLNWQKMKERKDNVVSKLKKSLKFSLEQAHAQILEGRGILKDKNTVEFSAVSGEKKIITAEYIILAMGADTIFPRGFEKSERIVTNHELLNSPNIPKTLLIIGGGVVGVEFASIFSALGTKVTIAEKNSRILSAQDADISHELQKVFARKNIEVLKNVSITPEQTGEFEKVLVAIGRKPLVSSDLDVCGIKYTNRGVETNEYMQTNVANVFAIGDLAGKMLLAYTADREGDIAAKYILGKKPSPIKYDCVATSIFCSPEVASIGPTEEEVQKRGVEYLCGKASFSANSKALILQARDGIVKVIVDKKTKKLLSVHIIGEKASELISEASLGIINEMVLEKFIENIHGHPILGETLIAACENAGGL